MKVSCKKGVTLIELVIASFILLLLVYAMYDVFTHGLLIWRLGSQRQDNEQKTIVVTNRLFYELKMTAASSITTFNYDSISGTSNLNYSSTATTLEKDANANNGISFRSPIDPDTGNIVIDDWMGKLRWQNYNIYYTKPDTKNVSKFLLCRREVPLGSKRGEVNSIPLEIFIPDGTTSAPGINTYINGSYTGTERVISRDVIKSLFRRNNYNEIEFFIEVGQPKEDYKDSPGNSKNRIRVIIRN